MDKEDQQMNALRQHRKKVIRNPETVVEDGEKVNDAEEKESKEIDSLDQDRILMKWKAPEFIFYEKSRRWYIIAVLVFAALIAFAVYSRSFLMAVTFVVAGAIFYLYAQKKPAQLNIEITGEGILYHDRFFPFEDLDGFWITYEPPDLKILSVSTRSLMIPKLSLFLTDQDPVELRRILIEELPEDKKLRDGAVEAFSRRIRF
ncbi:hypothetical protein ACFL0Z_01045 [Patescibacteria group bacterium]